MNCMSNDKPFGVTWGLAGGVALASVDEVRTAACGPRKPGSTGSGSRSQRPSTRWLRSRQSLRISPVFVRLAPPSFRSMADIPSVLRRWSAPLSRRLADG